MAADGEVAQRAHDVIGSLRPLSRCADTEALTAEVEPPPPEELGVVEAARAALARAHASRIAGRFEEAREGVEAAKRALEGSAYGPVQTEVAVEEGNVLDRTGEYEAAEAKLKDALRLGTRWKQWDLMQEAATMWMFVVGSRQRRTEDALELRWLAEELSQKDPQVEAGFRNNLASLLHAQGRYADAEAEARASIELYEAALGPEHPSVATAHNGLAITLHEQGRFDEAESEHRAALAVREATLGPEHPAAASSRNNLANIYYGQGRFAEAVKEYRAALAIFTSAFGPEHPHAILSRSNIAVLLFEQGKHAEAEAECRTVVAAQVAAHGPRHPAVASDRENLGLMLYEQGKYEEAEAEYRAALAIFEAALEPDHPRLAGARSSLALALLTLERADEGLPLVEAAWARVQREDVPVLDRADTAWVLARTLWTAKPSERDRARDLAGQARELYVEAGETHADMLRDIDRWLEEKGSL